MKMLYQAALAAIMLICSCQLLAAHDAQDSPLLPGTKIVPGDQSKNEFFIVADDEESIQKTLKQLSLMQVNPPKLKGAAIKKRSEKHMPLLRNMREAETAEMAKEIFQVNHFKLADFNPFSTLHRMPVLLRFKPPALLTQDKLMLSQLPIMHESTAPANVAMPANKQTILSFIEQAKSKLEISALPLTMSSQSIRLTADLKHDFPTQVLIYRKDTEPLRAPAFGSIKLTMNERLRKMLFIQRRVVITRINIRNPRLTIVDRKAQMLLGELNIKKLNILSVDIITPVTKGGDRSSKAKDVKIALQSEKLTTYPLIKFTTTNTSIDKFKASLALSTPQTMLALKKPRTNEAFENEQYRELVKTITNKVVTARAKFKKPEGLLLEQALVFIQQQQLALNSQIKQPPQPKGLKQKLNKKGLGQRSKKSSSKKSSSYNELAAKKRAGKFIQLRIKSYAG